MALTNYKEGMIDIETLGRSPGCVVLSIGLTPFNTDRVEDFGTLLRRTHHWAIDQASMSKYFIEPETLAWHQEDPDRAQQLIELTKIHQPLGYVLSEFVDAFKVHEFSRVWANSPSFDCAILKDVFDRENLQLPWRFWEERDVRTALHMGKINKKNIRPGSFVPHRADHDAAYQAHLVQLATRR